MFLENVGIYLHVHTALQPRRKESTSILLTAIVSAQSMHVNISLVVCKMVLNQFKLRLT
jgi:hypothetical protein